MGAVFGGASVEIVELLLKANPDAAKVQNENGMLPLHNAARRRAPVEVVKALLEANPDGAKVKDQFECLPLHWAFKSEASSDSVVALLEAYPDASKEVDLDGFLPLHSAIRHEVTSDEALKAILEANPDAAEVKSKGPHHKGGNTPVHLAAYGKASHEIIKELLKLTPDAKDVRNEGKILPMHYEYLNEKKDADGNVDFDAMFRDTYDHVKGDPKDDPPADDK